jgi:hypothetical protein
MLQKYGLRAGWGKVSGSQQPVREAIIAAEPGKILTLSPEAGGVFLAGHHSSIINSYSTLAVLSILPVQRYYFKALR